MRCRRCGGLMIIEPFDDEVSTHTDSQRGSLGTRCVNCGNVEDALIHTNRLTPQSVKRSARHNSGVEMGTRSIKADNS
jgi:hypothetical protein